MDRAATRRKPERAQNTKKSRTTCKFLTQIQQKYRLLRRHFSDQMID
jgi:hypothetical protein